MREVIGSAKGNGGGGGRDWGKRAIPRTGCRSGSTPMRKVCIIHIGAGQEAIEN